MPVLESGSSPQGGRSFDSELDAFMAGIRRLESGNNYMATGPMTDGMGQALGAYQIMSANWQSWANQAGLAGADWRDPDAQDAVARHKMTQYYNQYQDWGAVAVAWFAGPGKVDDYLEGRELGNVKDVLGTSVPDYVDTALTLMEEEGGNPEMETAPQSFVDVQGQSVRLSPAGGPDAIRAAEETIEGEDPVEQETQDQLSQALHPSDIANTVLEGVANHIAGGDRIDARTIGRGGAMEERPEEDLEDPEPLNPDTVVA